MPSKLRGFIIDLNGTVYFKEKALAGASAAVRELRAKGYELRFMTNTDSMSGSQLSSLVKGYGLELPAHEIYSAADASLHYLKTKGYRFAGLLPSALEEAFAPYRVAGGETPQCVLIGDNRRDISYTKLDALFQHLMAGAELLVMQPGRHYFLADGPHLDTGAFGALFEYATGQQATIMAKPSPAFFDVVLADMKLSASELMVVGDDTETDMIGAARIGARSVLVQTGKYQTGDEFLAKVKPDLVLPSLADLPLALAQL